MIDKLRIAWETFHPRSFTVSLRKQHPELYKWVLEQPDIIPTSTLADKVFVLLNPSQPRCQNNNCQNLVSILNRTGWASYCSQKCKGQHNSLKSRDKAKSTSIKNWGVDNPTKHKDNRIKMRETLISRSGFGHALQISSVREQKSVTMLEKYGVKHAAQSSVFLDKMKATCLEKYGVENSAQRNIPEDTWNKLNDPVWLTETNKTHSFEPLSQLLGISTVTLSKAFKKFNIEPAAHNKSVAELEIGKFLKDTLGDDYPLQTGTKKVIYPFEIDIYLPLHKVGIEYNGSWYHSELNGKERDYHIGKTNLCADKGIRLIHVWEHEYQEKRDIILSKLNHICGKSNRLFARKCIVKELSAHDADAFINSTHIQGSCISKHRLGLFHNDELVAVMTFGKTRFNKNYEWELLRYSSKLNHNIVGGFSKILNYFIKTYSPKSIITYSDKGWSVGNVYKNNGFKFSHSIPPSYFYTNDYKKFYNRINFQKKKLQSILENFNPSLTEWENMQNNGYDRIWNCGNDAWVWHTRTS